MLTSMVEETSAEELGRILRLHAERLDLVAKACEEHRRQKKTLMVSSPAPKVLW